MLVQISPRLSSSTKSTQCVGTGVKAIMMPPKERKQNSSFRCKELAMTRLGFLCWEQLIFLGHSIPLSEDDFREESIFPYQNIRLDTV